jgi:cell division protein FtsL
VKGSPTKSQKKRRKKRKARNTARQSIKALLPLLPFIAPIVATAFVYMWIYTSMNINSMPIAKLRGQRKELMKQNDSIQLRIEELQAPRRIESIAQKKLGMIPPKEYRVVVLDEPMRPPGIAADTQHPPEKRLRAKKESEGLLGFLNIGSLGSLNERETKLEDAPQKTASERAVRQPG